MFSVVHGLICLAIGQPAAFLAVELGITTALAQADLGLALAVVFGLAAVRDRVDVACRRKG